MSTAMNPANDIRKQAHQGSVTAIIQVLNQDLADLGVRTRAVFDGGVLQLLCEADTPGQLSPETLPDRVKVILESLAPRGVRRVNVNSRIVREQQLLWLDEINRDPEKLLWSKEVTLARPNFVKTILEDLQESFTPSPEAIGGLSPRQAREKRQFWRGILGGVGATIVLLGGGLVIYQLLQGNSTTASNSTASNSSSGNSNGSTPEKSDPAPSAAPEALRKPTMPPTATTAANGDSFATAVRLAEEAAAAGTKAQAPDDWKAIAEKWGKASELMGQVPQGDKNYTTAQDRTTRYKSNQASALTKAK
jgi:hypothetical protein